MESYSRVLESLAFNIVARIDDLLHVDDLTKHSDQFYSPTRVGVIGQKSVSIPYSVPFSSTPYRTAFTTPNFSPAHLVSPAKGDSSPLFSSNKIPHHGMGVKKVLLTDYLSIDLRDKEHGSPNEGVESGSTSNEARESRVSFEGLNEAVSLPKPEPTPENEP